MFVDEAQIEVVAGRGGDGMVAFRREKFVPRGGPAGGNGGKGGDIVIVATNNAHTLSDFRHKRRITAENGRPGGINDMTGREGKDTVIEVPVGTLVTDLETGDLIADLTEVDQRLVVAQGGRGGLGNARFVTPTNRAPRKFTHGQPGESLRIGFELKLIADVGLLGFPSVGKSTLISVLSSARPKIAAYPFTTLVPNLGVVQWKNFQEYVIADIPGLIEGAHQGHGLGIQFLKHVERTRMLVHIVEVVPDFERESGGRDAISDYNTLQEELGKYDPALLELPQIVVLNKIDLPYVQEKEPELRHYFEQEKGQIFLTISAATGENIDLLKDILGKAVADGEFVAPKEDWED